MINWMSRPAPECASMELNVESIKRAKAAREAQVATPVANDPDQPRVEALDDLPDEFTGNADPKGDACCHEPRCPCHEEQ